MGPKRDPNAAPVELTIIQTRLAQMVSAREARAITRRLSEHNAPTRNSQILAMLSITRDELQYEWSYRTIGSIFGVNKGTVHRVRSGAMREIEHDSGRPPILSPDQEADVIRQITTSYESGTPLSPKQIRAYTSKTYGKVVSSSWTWRFVLRHPEVLQRSSSMPQHIHRRMPE
jgi:hypothetical protein